MGVRSAWSTGAPRGSTTSGVETEIETASDASGGSVSSRAAGSVTDRGTVTTPSAGSSTVQVVQDGTKPTPPEVVAVMDTLVGSAVGDDNGSMNE